MNVSSPHIHVGQKSRKHAINALPSNNIHIYHLDFFLWLLLLEVDLKLVNGIACVETKRKKKKNKFVVEITGHLNVVLASLMDSMRKSFYKYTCRRPLNSSSMSPSPIYRRHRRRYIFSLCEFRS